MGTDQKRLDESRRFLIVELSTPPLAESVRDG